MRRSAKARPPSPAPGIRPAAQEGTSVARSLSVRLVTSNPHRRWSVVSPPASYGSSPSATRRAFRSRSTRVTEKIEAS